MAGVHAVGLCGGLQADAIPAIAQGSGQCVSLTAPLVQHIRELRFDHPQSFVIDGRDLLFASLVAIVHQRHKTFAAGQTPSVNLGRQPVVKATQCLVDSQDQLHRIALTASARSANVQAKKPGVMPCVADR
jgi:hypothetical protein